MIELVRSQNEISAKGSSPVYVQYIKPFFDIIISLSILAILAPLFAIIAVCIKLDSTGSVLFKQPRIGLDGKEFDIYKFRTMYIHTPSQGRSPESNHDPRITRVGRFLRKTSLDELPQLLNILKGDMSLVGPRPEQKQIVETYYTEFERQRFQVKPGITGLWQVSLDRTKPIHENLKYDFEYIKTVSLVEDLKIIRKTLMVIVRSNTF